MNVVKLFAFVGVVSVIWSLLFASWCAAVAARTALRERRDRRREARAGRALILAADLPDDDPVIAEFRTAKYGQLLERMAAADRRRKAGA